MRGLCGALRGGFCRVGFVSRGLREQFRGAVFVGAFVGCLLRGGFDSASCGCLCRAAFNCAFCGGGLRRAVLAGRLWGWLMFPNPAAGAEQRCGFLSGVVFVRRGFGPGRLLTGGGFGPGAAFDWVFLSGVALVRGGVEPTWLWDRAFADSGAAVRWRYRISIHPQRARSAQPLVLKRTPSASSSSRCRVHPGTVRPALFTTRWQGRPAGASASARPTRRAWSGMPTSRAICL